MQRAFFIVCVLGCAAAARAQSSSVMEWPPRPPPDMAQPIAAPDMGAPAGDLARPPSPAPDAKPAPPVDGGAIKTIDVPAGKTIDEVALPKGTITNGAAGIGDVITDVKIVDNTRTDSETVRYIAGVKPGDILTNELVTEVRERLLTVGLFKDVNVSWEPAVPGGNAGQRLILSAKDKLSWIIAPIFHYSPGDYGGGLAYANSNVFGGNKKFLVIGQYTTAQSFLFLAFLDPNIRNTRFYYRVDALLRRDDIWEYAQGHIGNPRIERTTNVDTFGAAALGGINFTRHFHFDLRLKIYYDNVEQSQCFNTTTSDGSGTPDVVAEQGGVCIKPARSGWDNTFTFHLGYDGRSNVYGV
ncbi:MAG TPA: POTRA domain-containing protein, partial [Polyangia bacterium]|nr:POTRA domain-containing protein [Polyangia bacterium]